MTTTTKLIIGAVVLGGVYVAAKQFAPQPKNPISQVIDSATGLVSKFTSSRTAQPLGTPPLDGSANYYSGTQDAAIADGRSLAKGTPFHTTPTTLTRREAISSGLAYHPPTTLGA